MEIWSRYSFLIENFRKAFITMAFNPIVVLSPLFKDFQKPGLYYPGKFNALWPTYSRMYYRKSFIKSFNFCNGMYRCEPWVHAVTSCSVYCTIINSEDVINISYQEHWYKFMKRPFGIFVI